VIHTKLSLHTDNAERYHYAHTCLHYERYTECIEQCDHIMTTLTATSSLHGDVKKVRGKSFAYLHQIQLFRIMMQSGLDVAVPLKGGNFVDKCAKTAKAAVIVLMVCIGLWSA